MDTKIDFKDPAYYENRELSWIKFDQRVLSEARDKSIPLLERLKFVSITSSNLDEFFMVRVASLKDMVHAKYKKRDIAGMTATEQLSDFVIVIGKQHFYIFYGCFVQVFHNFIFLFIVERFEDVNGIIGIHQ